MSKSKALGESRIAITVAGDSLDINNITDALQLTPTRVIHKGDVVGRIPAPLLAGQDQWICAHELTNPYGTDSVLTDLLAHLVNVKEQLQQLAATNTVTLQLYVKSDYAHMSYQLTSETLHLLADVGVPLEISSFSWGGM